MGLYNTIIGSPDDHLALGEDNGIQFKWGYCRLINYRIGDTIDWAGDRPSVADGLLELSGIAGGQDDFRYFVITIDNDVITGVREASEDEDLRLAKTEPRTLVRDV